MIERLRISSGLPDCEEAVPNMQMRKDLRNVPEVIIQKKTEI